MQISSVSSRDRYEPTEMVGHGAYGKVYKARDKDTNTFIAMKKMNINLEREGVPTTTLREVTLLKELNHPNIVRLFDVIVTEKQLYLIFEYIERDLRKVLDANCLTSGQIRKIMLQILEALNYCHSRRFMHRDLKPENILVDDDFNIKLADFGLARAYQIPGKVYTSEVQTLWYRAPEILLGCSQYSVSVDLWSVGCIFAEMVRNRPLFTQNNALNQLKCIFEALGTIGESDWEGVTRLKNFPSNDPARPGLQLELVFPGLDEVALDLMRQFLMINPNKRISARAALTHQYFNSRISMS